MEMSNSDSTGNLSARNLTVMAKRHRKNISAVPMDMTSVGGGVKLLMDDESSQGGS